MNRQGFINVALAILVAAVSGGTTYFVMTKEMKLGEGNEVHKEASTSTIAVSLEGENQISCEGTDSDSGLPCETTTTVEVAK